MNAKKKKQSKVYIQPWLRFHPYEKQSTTDMYYLRLANQVLEVMQQPEHAELHDQLLPEDAIELSCILTCYFEDVISETRIWKTFAAEHYKLYNKYVPFYVIDDHYYPDEINSQDVAFLIWHYYSQVFSEDRVYSPVSPAVLELAHDVFSVFDKEYETAPENPTLKEFLTLPDDVEDFYEVRHLIDWLGLHSYLHYHHGFVCASEKANFIDSIQKEDYDSTMFEYIKEIHDNYVLNKCGALLAYRPCEWLAHWAGQDHPLHQHLLNIIPKKTGYYLFIKEDEENLWFRHIATSYELPVTRKSIDRFPEMKIEQTILMIGFTRWKKRMVVLRIDERSSLLGRSN